MTDPLPSLTQVRTRYRKLALQKHPDKGFQELFEIYVLVSTYIAESMKHKVSEDDEENKLKRMFQMSNGVNVDTQSCTILIQNSLCKEWDQALSNLYHHQVPVQNGGRKWKVENYTVGNSNPSSVFITKWEMPSDGQPKLLIHGKHQYDFVIHELPLIYHQVLDLRRQTLGNGYALLLYR